MKCAAAFSILGIFAGSVAWGLVALHQHGLLVEVLAMLGCSIALFGSIVGVIWALETAVECWQSRG